MKYSSISCLPEYMLISALPDIPSDTFHKYHEALIHPRQITFGNKSKVVYLGPYIYKQGRQCRLAQMQTKVCTQRPLCWRRCLLLPFYTFVCHQASYRMSLIVFIHECSIFVAVWAGRFVYNSWCCSFELQYSHGLTKLTRYKFCLIEYKVFRFEL